MFIITSATRKIAALSKRIRAVAGGTAASKTVSILLVLIEKAQMDTSPTVTSVVSESFPHLKRGVMRDFLAIMEEHHYFRPERWNKSDFIYTFKNGSKLEFFSADQPGKVRGPRRDRLFINEANNISKDIFDQLEVRTKEFIFLDWNPVSEFWFYSDVRQREDTDFITLTYKDNEALSSEITQAIERRRDSKNWWRIYGLGELGLAEGMVYSDWQMIDEIPHEARLERYGLDFGYTIDPTALVAIYYLNGGYVLDEVLYGRGISNKQIADCLLEIPKALVVADSAEPKSIDEIKGYGLNVVGAEKGKDSVNYGIQIVQRQRISVTRRSVNLWKEYRNYLWATGRDGEKLNEPESGFDHCMDAIRYGICSQEKTGTNEELRDLIRENEKRREAAKQDYGI